MPNNQEDSKRIFEIIKEFKKYSSPEKTGAGTMLISPAFCEVTITASDQIQETLLLNEMVIADISTNFSPMGHMEMYHDNMPKSVVLSVTMVERKPKLYEEWNK
jgi:hypothetical protein